MREPESLRKIEASKFLTNANLLSSDLNLIHKKEKNLPRPPQNISEFPI